MRLSARSKRDAIEIDVRDVELQRECFAKRVLGDVVQLDQEGPEAFARGLLLAERVIELLLGDCPAANQGVAQSDALLVRVQDLIELLTCQDFLLDQDLSEWSVPAVLLLPAQRVGQLSLGDEPFRDEKLAEAQFAPHAGRR